MASFNGPKLTSPIRTDVPDTQAALAALAKQDPTPISDIPPGAKRLYEVSSGKWQWQEYSGSSWAPVPFLQHNVDLLDGYHATITPQANTIAVRNASGKLEGDITGSAATATSAETLSEILPVNKGGTAATTSAQARTNLGVPPTSHASTATTYGVANASRYGHVKLSDAVDSASGATGGTAATPAAVKAAKDAADAAMVKASTLATSSVPGIVKPGTGMTVNAAGALNVSLNNTVTSTSTTQAATAKAVKTAYDKGVVAQQSADSASAAATAAQTTADDALEAAQAATSSSGKVSLKGTRSTQGSWTITGLTIGKPLFILMTTDPEDGNYSYIYLEAVSGTNDGLMYPTGNIPVSFFLGAGSNFHSSNTFVVIPTETTVVISLAQVNRTASLRAYQ